MDIEEKLCHRRRNSSRGHRLPFLPEIYDTNIRVAGKVADSPVDWGAEEIELNFAVTEGGQTLLVLYHGPKPDGFTAGADIVVEGKYYPDNIFQATSIVLKCPSKYELEE